MSSNVAVQCSCSVLCAGVLRCGQTVSERMGGGDSRRSPKCASHRRRARIQISPTGKSHQTLCFSGVNHLPHTHLYLYQCCMLLYVPNMLCNAFIHSNTVACRIIFDLLCRYEGALEKRV